MPLGDAVSPEPSKDRVISRRRVRGNVRFRTSEQRACTTYVGAWSVQRANRRDATPRTDGWMDGDATLREITSHARNDRETVTLLSSPRLSVFLSSPSILSIPPRYQGLAMSSFLSTCGRRSATCLPAVSCFKPFVVASCSRFRETDDHVSTDERWVQR